MFIAADRGSRALPFTAIGVACVLAGGLLAAATAFTPSLHNSWATAYLVLVAGVAQVALGIGQAALAPQVPSRWIIAAELVGWNGGNAAVLTGTLVGRTPLVDIGGGLLVVALALFVVAAHGAGQQPRWSLVVFRLLVVILLVSIPIGLLLARTIAP